MRVSADRLETLGRSLDLALNQEWPQLVRVERSLAQLQVVRIPAVGAAPLPTIATVATDGGENKLSLHPIRLQIVRVADSRGEIYFEDFIPQSLEPEEIVRFFFQSDPKLQKFLAYLEVEWDDLLPTGDFQRSHLLQMLREMMEWAALLKLASQSPPRLLIHDGLLRSVLLPKSVFARLSDKFETLTTRHGHLLAGISKRSRIVNYLTVAFGLNQRFASGEPSYVRIPRELEREAAPPRYSWMATRAMGDLYIARFDQGPGVPLMPVELATWQQTRAEEAMALLHLSARGSFPIRGYPQALVQADEHARLGGLEIEMLERLLLARVAERDPRVAQKARELMLAGKRLSEDYGDEASE